MLKENTIDMDQTATWIRRVVITKVCSVVAVKPRMIGQA